MREGLVGTLGNKGEARCEADVKQVGNALGGVALAGSASSQMGVSHESDLIDPVIWNRSKLDHDICIIMCLQFCVSVSILRSRASSVPFFLRSPKTAFDDIIR